MEHIMKFSRRKYRIFLWGVCCFFVLVSCGPTIEEQQQAADAQYQLGIAEFNRGSYADALAFY